MDPSRIEVRAGAHRRRWCPVVLALDVPRGDGTTAGSRVLWDETGGRAVAHQLRTSTRRGLELVFVVDDIPAGGERSYTLRELDGSVPALSAGVRLKDSGGRLDIDVGASRFASYNYGPGVIRPYLYPVYAAPEIGVTRRWPMVSGAAGETSDHPHHKGIYTAQGEVNGVDNWSEAEGHGYQVHTAFSDLYSGQVAGGFVESLEWTDANRAVVMTETRSLCFYDVPQGLRIFDYEVRLHASHGAVTLGDTKEGGLLSIRVAPSMDASRPDGGRILNGDGSVGEAETWGKRASWCDYSGPVGRNWYGVCFMDHPANPRHPTYWHVRDYGLMTANCFGVHDFTGDPAARQDLAIPAGESRTWRYRVVVHAGALVWETLAGHYHDFAHSPAVAAK